MGLEGDVGCLLGEFVELGFGLDVDDGHCDGLFCLRVLGGGVCLFGLEGRRFMRVFFFLVEFWVEKSCDDVSVA